MPDILTKSAKGAIPLDLVAKDGFEDWLAGLDAPGRAWIKASGFKGSAGSAQLMPDGDGAPAGAALGVDSLDAVFAAGAGSTALPAGLYQIRTALSARQATDAAVAWALGAYAFDRYADKPGGKARLVWPKGADRKTAQAIVDGVRLGRDRIVTPANDLGPAELADAAKALAKAHKAKCSVIVGDDLLKKNFPTIHAVGRASTREPRLIDLSWQG
ncbi:MAG: leucyl aminopeptidase family protein, partial [Alphaproteobacteria bacterium]